MATFRMVVPENTITEYLYEVEADSQEEAIEKVKNNEINGTLIYTFSTTDSDESRHWEDATIVEVKE